ncbi:MAG: MgtC/SapB family protein [Candidatus Diapherotrites archaeon]|nr:MgtC/SapB family protein [Candidatus Diapherotrites archaeon]
MLSETEIVIRLIIAAGLGMAIGYEREISEKPAGIRTFAIVSIGACLFTIIGILIGETNGGAGIDATRIAAGIITGIGFLGAGALFQSNSRVLGLTTAAGIWSMGAVGLAVGLGYTTAAILATALMYLVLLSGRFYGKQPKIKAEKKEQAG